LLDQPGQEREVVVLDEDERRIHVGRLGEDGRGELLVHRLVVCPVLRAKLGTGVHDVAERPQPLVGEAQVVARLLFLAQPDALQQIARVVLRQSNAAGLVGHLAVCVAARLGDPDAPAGAHHRLHGRDEAGGRMLRLDPSVLPDMAQRLAIRHDEERRATEPELDELLQPLFGPQRLAHQSERRLFFRSGPRAVEAFGHHRHLVRHGPEDAWIRDVERRRRRASAKRLGPSGHLGQRLHHGDAHDEQRDAREDNDEDEEAYAVVAPEAPLGFHHRLSVEGHEERSHRPLVAKHRTRVDVDGAATEPLEPSSRLLARESGRHLGKGIGQDGTERGGSGLDGAETVEEGQTLPALAELHEEALEGRAAASGEGRLGGFG
jgi:hypothetical protein